MKKDLKRKKTGLQHCIVIKSFRQLNMINTFMKIKPFLQLSSLLKEHKLIQSIYKTSQEDYEQSYLFILKYTQIQVISSYFNLFYIMFTKIQTK
jgi:hypothetical protein